MFTLVFLDKLMPNRSVSQLEGEGRDWVPGQHSWAGERSPKIKQVAPLESSSRRLDAAPTSTYDWRGMHRQLRGGWHGARRSWLAFVCAAADNVPRCGYLYHVLTPILRARRCFGKINESEATISTVKSAFRGDHCQDLMTTVA